MPFKFSPYLNRQMVKKTLDQFLDCKNHVGKLLQISEDDLKHICNECREVYLAQPALIEVEAPINVCGDIHGQFHDLLRWLEHGGMPPSQNYLFLGDYVDRGRQSIETFVMLLCFKLLYPENLYMLRGNHECASICRVYGFYDEVKRRYSVKMWKIFCDVFNTIPLCGLIDNKIMCMHGGISPSLQSFDQIVRINRPTDLPDVGLLCDLTWADPDPDVDGWAENDRGVSYVFGEKMVEEFNSKFKLDLICRAHQVVEDGYEFFANKKLVTMFSAPNYCGEFDNCGAMMQVDAKLKCKFKVLKPVKAKMKSVGGRRGTTFAGDV